MQNWDTNYRLIIEKERKKQTNKQRDGTSGKEYSQVDNGFRPYVGSK